MNKHAYCLYWILILTAMTLSSCVSSSSNMTNLGKQSLYDRVIQSGKIRCCYIVYPPDCIKDPNTGKLSGIGVEALELVAKKLGLKVEWTEEVGTATMLEGLITGRYDMMGAAVWTNAQRAKRAAFSKPMYFTVVSAFARKKDNRFKGHLERINSPNVKISIIDGETGQVIADADFPKASRLSMPQMTDFSQNMLNVATGKADVAFADSFCGARYVRNNPGILENINPQKPVRIYPNCWMFNRGEFEFKEMLDTVLDEVINSGAMDKIISKYEQAPNEVDRIALPYQLPN